MVKIIENIEINIIICKLLMNLGKETHVHANTKMNESFHIASLDSKHHAAVLKQN